MIKEYEKQTNYWRQVLKRAVATVKLIATLGLGFREHDSSSKGNFMSCLEFLAEFDIFLKTRLETYSICSKGHVNCLSNTTCDEFIGLMATNARNTIINDIKQAKYVSLTVGSTPVVSHADQLSFIIRYVGKQNQIKERFLSFKYIEKHDASYLENIIKSTLTEYGRDIQNCRGQSYDNAANMSGIYNGLQPKIKSHSKNAFFIPCAARNLDLVGNSAAQSCLEASNFFDFTKNLFVFFLHQQRDGLF
jgi:hypothetical protein